MEVLSIECKIHCLLCNKDIGRFTIHSRAKHPRFYRVQLQYDMEVYRQLQNEIERLVPETKNVARDKIIIKYSGEGLRLWTREGTISLEGKPLPENHIIIDYYDYDRAIHWVHHAFPRVALANLKNAPDEIFEGQEIFRQQLELVYQSVIRGAQQIGATPSVVSLAAARDNCDRLIKGKMSRLKALEKEQETLASGGYICPVCAGAFQGKGALRTHIRKKHPKEYETQIETEERARYSSIPMQDYEIARRKFDLFLSHDKIDDAIEQLRIQKVKSLEIYGDEDVFIGELFEKHFKHRGIPREIQDQINNLTG